SSRRAPELLAARLASGWASSAADFEQTGGAHAAADAHAHDAVALAAPAELVQQRGGELRARAPERVPEGDGAAVDVELVCRDAELALAVHGLSREGLVDLEQVDVVDLQARLREQLADGGHRPDAHDVGVDPGDGEAAQAPERLDAQLLRLALAEQHGRGRAVAERRAVARRHAAALGEGGRQLGEHLERGAGAGALVLREVARAHVAALEDA